VNESCTSSQLDHVAPSVDWARFAELIDAPRQFLLTTHVRPDCDALGSTLAMAGILERLGKEARVVVGYEVPPNLHWIDPGRKILCLGEDISRDALKNVEVLMVLDTSAWAQVKHMEEVIRSSTALKIVVDHHLSSDDLGAEMFKNTSAEATGRLVVEAAEHLGVELTPELATPLFAAVATDTGWFRFASTRSDTYHLAARLVDAGASPHAIYGELYEKETLARLRLVGRAMARVETDLDGQLVYSWIEREDFDAVGALPTDSEDVINMMLSVGGTKVAIILVEQIGGGFKISFRSRCHVDCSRLAEQFGGGGHQAAAGAMILKPLETARTMLLDAARVAMR